MGPLLFVGVGILPGGLILLATGGILASINSESPSERKRKIASSLILIGFILVVLSAVIYFK